MGREYDGIRDLVAEQVERLEKIFPGKNFLRQKEIADAFEISTASVRRWYGIGSQGLIRFPLHGCLQEELVK